MNGHKADGVDRIQIEGTISAGEFGSTLSEIFDPRSLTSFTWLKTAKVSRRSAYVFGFRVPQENGATVTHRESGQQIVAAFHGEVAVDQEVLDVLRIHVDLELPKAFPIQMSELSVSYQPVNIAGKAFLPPLHSEVRVKDMAHLYVNRIDFKNYQKFTSETTIHYDGAASQ